MALPIVAKEIARLTSCAALVITAIGNTMRNTAALYDGSTAIRVDKGGCIERLRACLLGALFAEFTPLLLTGAAANFARGDNTTRRVIFRGPEEPYLTLFTF